MILVFVGAGGSAAVDEKQYLTTRGFLDQLPKDIKDNHLFSSVYTLLTKHHGKTKPDIEDVLQILDAGQAVFPTTDNPLTLLEWIMSGQMASNFNFAGVSDWGGLRQSFAGFSAEYIAPLSNAIKTEVYRLYAEIPQVEQIADWALLLKGLQGIDPTLEIFTTNYDRVLETVIKETGINIRTGRDFDDVDARLNTDFWDMSVEGYRSMIESFELGGLLTKLHGSVDWQRRNGAIHLSPVYAGSLDRHSLLYPGYKGTPTEEPFRMFHRHFRNVTRGIYGELTAAVFVGFAFRDEYINEILRELSPLTPMYFITIEEERARDNQPPLGFPFTLRPTWPCRHYRKGLTQETVIDCLESIERMKDR